MANTTESIMEITETKKNKTGGFMKKKFIITCFFITSIMTLSACENSSESAKIDYSLLGNSKIIEDEQVPITDSAENEEESTDGSIVTLEEGKAESYLEELEDGEQAIGSTSDAFSLQGEEIELSNEIDKTLEENSECVGYLYFSGLNEGTLITYNGDVYLDSGNYSNFTDPNTILYGSAKENKNLSDILVYSDGEFFDANPFIYVYTKDYIYEYRVFAAYSGEKEDILIKYNCYDFNVFSNYINTIYSTRSMDACLNTSLQEAVSSGWRILTIMADKEDENSCYYLHGTFSGSKER